MNTLKEKIKALNQLILSGKAMDAFERFYHNDVAMQENENPPVIGKEANRKRELEFFNQVTGFHEKAIPREVAVGENVSMVIWEYDYHHREWGAKKYTQVSVQHWKDGQIIKERFFYGN